MKPNELKTFVQAHRADLIEALRDADRTAYQYTNCEYSVALYPDGSTERRERLAGSNWWYQNDSAVAEFGPLCHQYTDPLRDNLASDELLYLLESEMNETERTAYDRYRKDFAECEEEEPDDWEAVNWIEEDLPDLWERVLLKAIEEMVNVPEADEQYETLIDESLDLLLAD